MTRLSAFVNREDIKSYISRSWSVSWPLTLIMLFEFLIGLTDVYIAGRVSKEIQAAYGFVIQLYFVLIVIANALTVGTVSVVSRLYTSGDKNELVKSVFSSLVGAAGAGAFLACGGFLFSPYIVHVLNIPQQLKQYVIPLIGIYATGLFFHYLLINSNGLLRSSGRIKDSLKTQALVCVLNIGLNFFLVFHTPLGFRGIAAATASSVFIGSVVNLWKVRSSMTGAGKFSIDLVRKMITIGWPIGMLQVLWQLSSMVLFLILSALPEHRVEILAALTTGLRIESVIYLPVFGFNMANAVIVGNMLGEKREQDAFRSGFITAAIGVLIVTVMVIAVILNARWIASFLSNNEIVIRESTKYIYISMISEPFMAWGIILGGGLNGAGDTRSVLMRVALSVWLVRIPLSYIFVVFFGFGPASVWWSMNISQFVQAFVMSKRYFDRKWLSLEK
ncbi:MAG: MATE family efflux transporter [Thermodesulfobacteriota bacterium]